MEAQAVEGRTARLLRRMDGRKRLLVLTHTNPDPDSLGAAVGLRHLAREKLGLEGDLALSGRIMRAENRAMVRCLEIDMVPVEELDLAAFDCLAVVDTQPGFGHTRLPEGRTIDIVIDHHVPADTAALGRQPTLWDIRTDVGATSSMVTDYLVQLDVPVNASVATALFYGITTDTLDLSRNTSRIDHRAYDWLMPRVDRKRLAQITKPDLPLEYYRALRDALGNVRIYDDIVLCSLGETHGPEMVAEVADLLLRLEGNQAVFCGGLIGETYHVSVRTELDGRDAYDLICEALNGEGTFGGHGSVAGGSVVLPDASPRTLKRLERRLERNILQAMGQEGATPSGLGES